MRALERQNTVIHKPRAWLFQTLYHSFISLGAYIGATDVAHTGPALMGDG